MRVGSYRLIELLGSGGMGEVWLARHRLLARPAAVKIVREPAVGRGEEAHRPATAFRSRGAGDGEPPVAAHRAAVRFRRDRDGKLLLRDGAAARNGPAADGRTSRSAAAGAGRLSAAAGVSFVVRSARAGTGASRHQAGEPLRLPAGPDYDFLKVLDFGVVSRQEREPMTPITVAGMVLGTPAFLAPELVSGQGSFDGRADIYALGCVAFWLLTGRPPFEAGDTMSLLMHHSKTTPSPPSAIAEEAIPADLDALVLECLSKEPFLPARQRRPAGRAPRHALDRQPLGPAARTRVVEANLRSGGWSVFHNPVATRTGFIGWAVRVARASYPLRSTRFYVRTRLA